MYITLKKDWTLQIKHITLIKDTCFSPVLKLLCVTYEKRTPLYKGRKGPGVWFSLVPYLFGVEVMSAFAAVVTVMNGHGGPPVVIGDGGYHVVPEPH